MACLPADVRALGLVAGDFLDPPFTDVFLQLMITNAACVVDPLCDVARADKLTCALAAHFASQLSKGGKGAVGGVTAERAGGLARSYGAVMSGANDNDLGATVYGNMFMLIRAVSPCGVVPMVLSC